MMEILVGHTGFVGGNIAASHSFDMLCHSKNISDAFGTNPDLLVYSGVPAEMFLANSNPDADRAVTENAAETIRKINPRELVLISTIAVIDNPVCVDEDVIINPEKLTAYGLNRFRLEQMAGEIIPRCHIIRLPALFGMGIKKNFIYDMIQYIPAMLNKQKYEELSSKEPMISRSYIWQDNGFYKLVPVVESTEDLKAAFSRCHFSALHFTDSRSVFQFYHLTHLWEHIQMTMEQDIPILHTATEPLSAGRVYEFVSGEPFENELERPPFHYDYRTKYAQPSNGQAGYLMNAAQVLSEIKDFVERKPS